MFLTPGDSDTGPPKLDQEKSATGLRFLVRISHYRTKARDTIPYGTITR